MSVTKPSLRDVLPEQSDLFKPTVVLDRHCQSCSFHWPNAEADTATGQFPFHGLVPVKNIFQFGGVHYAEGIKLDPNLNDPESLADFEAIIHHTANTCLAVIRQFEVEGRPIVFGLVEQGSFPVDQLHQYVRTDPTTLWLGVVLQSEDDWQDFVSLTGWGDN